MRLLLMAMTVSLVAAAGQASTDPDPAPAALAAKAEACIRAKAAGAAQVSKTPSEAVTFLVEGLCAGDIQHFQDYQRNSAMLSTWRAAPAKPRFPVSGDKPPSAFEQQEIDDIARTNEQVTHVSIDPETGAMVTPPGFKPPF